MNDQTFLILGASGLIGEMISKDLQGKAPWIGTTFSKSRPQLTPLDLFNSSAVENLISRVKPAYVILGMNLGGGVSLCEKDPALAKRYHFELTKNVASICQSHGAKFIYISTECVFDGVKEIVTEEEPVHPINVYGQCKVLSEYWIRTNLTSYLIIRTTSVFGWQPDTKSPNAVMSLYFALSKKQNIFAPTYRFSTPTYVGDLSKAIIELCLNNANGTYHVVGPTWINRYEWLKKTCQYLGWNEQYLKSEEQSPKEGVRYPSKVRLDTTKFRTTFKTKLHSLEDSLAMLKSQIENSDLKKTSHAS